MKQRRSIVLESGRIVAVTGVVAATLGVSDPGSTIAVPILAILGIGLTVMLARMHKSPRRAEFLLNLMLLGVGVRLYAFAMIHSTVGPYVFAPDAMTYESWGMGLLAYLGGDAPIPRGLADTLQIAYPSMNAALFAVFGPAKAAPAVANMFFSCWTAIPLYHIALAVVRDNDDVARWAAILTVLFPSMILWSVLNVREAPAILTITLIVLFLVRAQKKLGLADISGVVVGLAVLTLFREYLTTLVAAGGLAGLAMGRGRSPGRMLILGTFLLLVVTLAAQSFGFGSSLTGEPTELLADAQRMRDAFQIGAGSAYGSGADIASPGGALAFLPIGLVYFLFAPFPWAISSGLQAITLPEILVWYALVPFAWRGMRLGFRHDLRSYTVPASVFVAVTFSYSLVEANIGTAYRHRAQILPIVFLFCAVGLSDWFSVWARRRAQSQGIQSSAAGVRNPRAKRHPTARR